MNMKAERAAASALLITALLISAGCSHKPVYPEIGDAIIDSSPRGAEVLIDGVRTYQMTPCRVTGIAVGVRQLTLRYNNCRTLNTEVTIKAGQAVRLHFTLQTVSVAKLSRAGLGASARVMLLDREKATVYVATNQARIQKFVVGDSSLAGPLYIDAKAPPTAISFSARHGLFAYVCNFQNAVRLVCMDLNTGLVIREHIQPDSSRYVKLALSPDENTLLVADSLGRRLLVMDVRTCAMVKGIPLSGHPSDVVFGGSPEAAYVTLCGSKRLARVDLTAGAEREWAPTGNNPRGLFWSLDSSQLGCCNSTDRQLTLVNLSNWSSAIVMSPNIGGTRFPAACWTDDPFYLMVLIEGENPPGVMNIAYTPNWFTISKLNFGRPVGIERLATPQRYVILTHDSLHLVKGEFR